MSKTVSTRRSAWPGWGHGWVAQLRTPKLQEAEFCVCPAGVALRKQHAEGGASPGPWCTGRCWAGEQGPEASMAQHPQACIPESWEPCWGEWTLARGHRKAGSATCSGLCHQVKNGSARAGAMRREEMVEGADTGLDHCCSEGG